MFQNVLFDLDGTLVRSGDGILASICYACEKMEVPLPPEDVLRSFIGPPLRVSFRERFGLSAEDAERMLGFYRECYRNGAMFRAELYEGIKSLLCRLRAAGVAVFVATGKPEWFATQILVHFGVAELFADIVGSVPDGARDRKDEVIGHLLKKHPSVRESVVMIGDSDQDLAGAAACGIPAIGVLYGYGDPAQMAALPHLALVRDVAALERLLFENTP